MTFSQRFSKFATTVARYTGKPPVFAACLLAVVVWALSGPLFGFSDTWQLVINTSTTIITFLMVFLIQNTQNRDNNALHAKLDELIRVGRAHNSFIGIENLDDDELEKILADLDKLSDRLRKEAGPGPAHAGFREKAAEIEAERDRLAAAAASRPKAAAAKRQPPKRAPRAAATKSPAKAPARPGRGRPRT